MTEYEKYQEWKRRIDEYCGEIKQANVWSDGKPRSGFFPLGRITTCRDPEHLAPSHITIPQGQGYRHVCPSCGHVQVVMPPQVFLSDS